MNVASSIVIIRELDLITTFSRVDENIPILLTDQVYFTRPCSRSAIREGPGSELHLFASLANFCSFCSLGSYWK